MAGGGFWVGFSFAIALLQLTLGLNDRLNSSFDEPGDSGGNGRCEEREQRGGQQAPFPL
jgi:hypothetical protein